jgi:hypothetical protein
MRAYFLNISEEEKKSIQEKQRSIYDGYQTMEPKMNKQTPLNVENLALDEVGITVNNKGEVSGYKNTGINKLMKKVCKNCGTEMKVRLVKNVEKNLPKVKCVNVPKV